MSESTYRDQVDILDALPRILQIFQDKRCNIEEVKSFLLGSPPVPWNIPTFDNDVWSKVKTTLHSQSQT
jgi:hypothetical protein